MEDEGRTEVSVEQLAVMLAKVANNYAPGVTVHAVHFDKSANNKHVVLETNLGYGEFHKEYIDVPEL